ncbi:sensor histidine kinase [Pedobacter boryungensis]|uniref:histidine kinase n=1 Tax=Pedobacter boryungensis TaxID=869962 RepID=A0ABX2D9Q2_9SPHI|nr:HAMP domain-containing sensor histidine kinase [Pedobacter boryungensis]NQX30781.1 HAMP domain-containing histidine kinase [Pedobacter boryungensis]
MKLSTKLILFITGSKFAVVLLFVLCLPFLVQKIASEYTNYSLREQQKKVIKNVEKNGVDYYLQGEKNFGSYTMLKEEYISIEQSQFYNHIDTIKNAQRVFADNDTLNYRILSYTFINGNRPYLLEIGKATSSINQYNKPLQRFALYILIALIALTVVIDLVFTRILIKPLAKIISTKLLHRKFPFRKQLEKVKTSTTDFNYLDESLISLMNKVNEAFVKEKEFTANASHELMTPISILQSKMENLMADEPMSEEVTFRIMGMMKTLDRLKKISSSLLLISRIENEQFIKNNTVKPLQLIQEIVEEIGHRLRTQNISIEINISSSAMLKNVNYDLLFQLFYNLINNAIKFNVPNGSIFISDKELENKCYEIEIRDTGIGIAKDQIPFVFDRFSRTNATETTGHGLGLAIVKSIAIYHQLEINVESEMNKGTTFRVVFPY